MDSKNPIDQPHNLSPEELFKLLDAEKDGQDTGNLDEFEREALEGLKMVKNREKVFELNSKIDALLDEEKNRKALILPLKNNKGLYYIAMAASVALIIGFFFIFKTAHKDEKMAVKKDAVPGQVIQPTNGTATTESAPPPVDSDEKVVEEKINQEKEAFKTVLGEGKDKGPVSSGKGVSDREQTTTKNENGEGYFAESVNKEISKTEEQSNNYKAPPVINMDEVVADHKAKADNVYDDGNVNTVSTTTAYNQVAIPSEDSQKKKEAESEKKAIAYNSDMNSTINNRQNDSIIIPDLAKNNWSNSNTSNHNGTANSPVPSGSLGLTTTTPTYSWNTTTGNAVLAKASKVESNKSKGKKRKTRSASYTPAYSGTTKREDKKTRPGKDVSDNDIALKAAVAQKQQDQKALEEDESSVLTAAETMPGYPGGTNEMAIYLSKNLDISKASTSAGNKVFMSLVVKADGSLSEIKITKGLEDCKTCRESVLKAFNSMPKWKPGVQNGKNVSVQINLPVTIELK